MSNYTLNEKPNNALIYIRVSSEEQVENFSLGTQEEICRKEAIKRGLEIIETFREEGKSAKSIVGRPILLQMLEYCRKNKRNINAVLIYRLDRISRQTADYLAIRKKLAEYGIALISATEPTGNSPTEKLVETMLAGFAQLDNDVRSERTRNGLRARFLAGLPMCKVPLGYLNENGYIIKDPDTFDKLQKSWELMAVGNKSLKEITIMMNNMELYSIYKGQKIPLTRQTVQKIFRNKFYMGIISSSKYPEEIRGQHTPMIKDQVFYKVQSILDGRNTNIKVPIAKKNKDNDEFPLRRILICGNCGTPFTGAWTKGRNSRYAYYFCRNRCGMPSVPIDNAYKALIESLDKVSITKEGIEVFISILRKKYMQRISSIQKKSKDNDIDLTKLYAQR